jgi:hypothetical protein
MWFVMHIADHQNFPVTKVIQTVDDACEDPPAQNWKSCRSGSEFHQSPQAEAGKSKCCCALAARRLSNMWQCTDLVMSTAEVYILTEISDAEGKFVAIF